MIIADYYDSPLGKIIMTSREDGLSGLWFVNQKYERGKRAQEEIQTRNLPVFQETKKWLDRYFEGENPEEVPYLTPEGSPFQMEVWDILKTIPYGKTMTYGQIAQMIAEKRGLVKMSAQAVGGAVGHNPVSILIPCHRVVGAGGNLTGYAGGLDKKIALLKREGVDMSSFFVPKKGTAL